MTKSQKVQVEQSEVRQKLNVLLNTEDRTEEQAAEMDRLSKRMGELESEYRAAVAVEATPETEDKPTPDAEHRERLELRSKASIGRIVDAALKGRNVNGAEAEIAAAAGVAMGTIPFELFEVEQRAITPTPGTTGTNFTSIQPAVFASSIAGRLGIDMPTVGSGTYSVPKVSTSLTAGAVAAGSDTVETAMALEFESTTPHRYGGGFAVRAETLAAVGLPDFEAALRTNLQQVMGSVLDDAILNGDGTGNAINGLVNQLAAPDDPAAANVGFADFVGLQADQIDGLFAGTAASVNMFVNVDVMKLAMKAFATNTSNESAAAYLQRIGGGFASHQRMAATKTNVAVGLVHRTGLPGLMAATLPSWGSIQIEDPYTDARKATTHFVASVLLGDVVIVQGGAYALFKNKVA